MKKAADNYLAVFEKIYYSESIREEEADKISWKSSYLESLNQVVKQQENEATGWLEKINPKIAKLNLFNRNSSKFKKSPLLHFLVSLLKKEPQ